MSAAAAALSQHPTELRVRLTHLCLDVIEDVLAFLCLLSPASHDDAAASDDFDCLSLCVEPRESRPLAQHHVGRVLDERDRVLLAQSCDRLGVRRLIARVRKHEQVSVAAMQCLDSLVQYTR